MNNPQHAFRTVNPEHCAFYVQAIKDSREHLQRIFAFAEERDPALAPYGRKSGFSNGKSTIEGLSPKRGAKVDAPAGWRWLKTYDCFKPVKSKAGAVEQEALDRLNALCPDAPNFRLAALLGFPAMVWRGRTITYPSTVGDPDAPAEVWLTYATRLDSLDAEGDAVQDGGMPDSLPEGVTEQPLSVFYAFREALDAKKTEDAA